MERGAERVLVAAVPAGQQIIANILSDCDVDFAAAFEEGLGYLQARSYSHVIVGYLFAESRMFEFAQAARERQPHAKVLCIKGAGRPLDEQTRRGLDFAVRTLGCDCFVDLTGGEIPEDALPVFNEILRHCRAEAAY